MSGTFRKILFSDETAGNYAFSKLYPKSDFDENDRLFMKTAFEELDEDALRKRLKEIYGI